MKNNILIEIHLCTKSALGLYPFSAEAKTALWN
jgi:hypothetical protein